MNTVKQLVKHKRKVLNKKVLDVSNLRKEYNELLDSIFYLIEDIEEHERLIENKYYHLKKLQAAARLIDLRINYEYGIFNIKKSGHPEKVLLQNAVQHVKKLRAMPKNVRTKRTKNSKNKR